MESRFWSKFAGRPSASTAMLYSLICAAEPSKYLAQTYLSNSSRLGARLNMPEARTVSNSCLSCRKSAVACIIRSPKLAAGSIHAYGGRVQEALTYWGVQLRNRVRTVNDA